MNNDHAVTVDEDEDPYVNEECADQCGTEHDTHYTYRCPETLNRWTECAGCGEVVNAYSTYYHEGHSGYSEGNYCQDCWGEIPEYDEDCNCYDCRMDRGRVDDEPPPEARSCYICNTRKVNMNLLTEEFICSCELQRLIEDDPDFPVFDATQPAMADEAAA